MKRIKSRIKALEAVLGTGGNPDFFDLPLEVLDPISRSIVETVRELESLNTAEKKEYCREHQTTPEEIQSLINLLRTGYYD